MTFYEAVSEAVNGKRIRNSNWPETHFAYINTDDSQLYIEYTKPSDRSVRVTEIFALQDCAELTIEEMREDEWEISQIK